MWFLLPIVSKVKEKNKTKGKIEMVDMSSSNNFSTHNSESSTGKFICNFAKSSSNHVEFTFQQLRWNLNDSCILQNITRYLTWFILNFLCLKVELWAK